MASMFAVGSHGVQHRVQGKLRMAKVPRGTTVVADLVFLGFVGDRRFLLDRQSWISYPATCNEATVANLTGAQSASSTVTFSQCHSSASMSRVIFCGARTSGHVSFGVHATPEA